MTTNQAKAIQDVIANPDHFNRSELIAALADYEAAEAIACLAPKGSLAQIVASMDRGWVWNCDGWERHTADLVGLITDPRYMDAQHVVDAWSRIPSAVGILRDRTDELIAWARQWLNPEWYADLAILIGPSNASAQLLLKSPFEPQIGRALRYWSMATNPDDATAWQNNIDASLLSKLKSKAAPEWAFPAWGWDEAVSPGSVLPEIIDDILAGWSRDHASIRGRIAWLETKRRDNLDVGGLAFIASVSGSKDIAASVCTAIESDVSNIDNVAWCVPWGQLHPWIQIFIDDLAFRSNSPMLQRTWGYAKGYSEIKLNTPVDNHLLLWRIAPEAWSKIDPVIRDTLVSSIMYLPDHCYGWGVAPDLVAQKPYPAGRHLLFWNPTVAKDDLRAWTYADTIWRQQGDGQALGLIEVLMALPHDVQTRFDRVIDWRLGNKRPFPDRPQWDWSVWGTLPATERRALLTARFAAMWGDWTTPSIIRIWRARGDDLAVVAMTIGDVLEQHQPAALLAALIEHTPALRESVSDRALPIPYPPPMDASLREILDRMVLDPDDQTYAAWCWYVMTRRSTAGADFIAIHPGVAIALAPMLTTSQRAMVASSPATQGWDSMAQMHWVAACASDWEQTETLLPRVIA